MKDTKLQSLRRGRYGAAVLALVAVISAGFGMAESDQIQLKSLVESGLVLLAGIMAFKSKFKEKS